MLRLRYSAASKDDLKEIARFIAKDKPVAANCGRWWRTLRLRSAGIARMAQNKLRRRRLACYSSCQWVERMLTRLR